MALYPEDHKRFFHLLNPRPDIIMVEQDPDDLWLFGYGFATDIALTKFPSDLLTDL
jgi:hypothetical protein